VEGPREFPGIAKSALVAIGLLRDELAAAQDAGRNHQFKFEINEAEIELLVELDVEGEGEIKATFGVVTVGAGGRVSRGNTPRLLLKLKVKDEAVGRRNLEISRNVTRTWDTEYQPLAGQSRLGGQVTCFER